MARDLAIGKHWFHKDHYDIPIRRVEEIKTRCELVSTRTICLIKSGQFMKLPLGEVCTVCGREATRKVGEESTINEPIIGHNLTAHLCKEHFNMVIRPYLYKEQRESIIERLRNLLSPFINYFRTLEKQEHIGDFYDAYFKTEEIIQKEKKQCIENIPVLLLLLKSGNEKD